jgi:hypothetical protein
MSLKVHAFRNGGGGGGRAVVGSQGFPYMEQKCKILCETCSIRDTEESTVANLGMRSL